MYTEQQHCHTCKQVTWHSNGACDVCYNLAEHNRILQWNAMSVEARLNDLREKIEKMGPNRLC